MAPALTIDSSSDFQMATANRTLLLAPPAVAARPDALSQVVEAYDRNATDIQMLDRLAMGLVSLPSETYNIVLLLTDIDGPRDDSARLLDRNAMARVVASLRLGGRLRSQDGGFSSVLQTEAILAGLVKGEGDEMVKPNSASGRTVSLRLGKKKANAAAIPANNVEAVNVAKRKSDDITTGNGTLTQANGHLPLRSTPAGVGFIDSSDDFDGGFDDGNGYESDDMEIPSNEELERAEKIDPSTLLTDADLQKPLNIPEACKPNTKRRRACKDCTCGLAQRLEAEDKAKRADADANLAKLSANDLAEVDFTVQGKVGSCGNCALGDAFRCDGCPYIGLPAFKPGEEVQLLNNDVQL